MVKMTMIQVWDAFLAVLVFTITFIVFLLFLYNDVVLTVALIVFAICVTDFIIKMTRDSLPNKLLVPTSDKAVLITGCDSGFGNKFARQLDVKGITVFAGCLFSEGPGAKQLKENCSKNVHILQMDVTKDDQIKSAFKHVVHNLNGKKLWAVVNNSGILIMGEAEYTSIESTKNIIDVNTLGVVRVTQTFLPLLRQCKGRVVIVTSVAGRVSFPALSSYCMSKQATMAYAHVLRRELMRWGVSVHTVEPWAFKTGMSDKGVVQRNLWCEWNQAPHSVRADYGGDNYIKNFLNNSMMSEEKTNTKAKLSLVTDCLMDAALGRFPKMHYFPGFVGRVIIYINNKLPTSIMDLIWQIILPKLTVTTEHSNFRSEIQGTEDKDRNST